MASVPDKLKAIIDYKHGEVAKLKRERSLDALEADGEVDAPCSAVSEEDGSVIAQAFDHP